MAEEMKKKLLRGYEEKGRIYKTDSTSTAAE